MKKEIFNEVVTGKVIDRIEFGIFSPDQVYHSSVLECINFNFYSYTEKDRQPINFGPLDTRLGVSCERYPCKTCGQTLANCIGHFGQILLCYPCFHAGFIKKAVQVLQCICKKCGALLMSNRDKKLWLDKIEKCCDTELQYKNTVKAILLKAKTCKLCKRCGYLNGTVKKANPIKVVHEKVVLNKNDELTDEEKIKEKILKPGKQKNRILLNPDYVIKLFNKINPIDASLLGFRRRNKPTNLIFRRLPVSPACIRPSVACDIRLGSNEDDISIKISEIIFKNQTLLSEKLIGAKTNEIIGYWDSLQALVSMMITGDLRGLPVTAITQEGIRSFIHRIKGKSGRFRGNLSGKRVDFSGRTVISPDPNISIDQVIVPVQMAKILTFTDVVNRHNIEKIRKAVLNGHSVHPGVNFIKEVGSLYKKYLKFCDLKELANKLKCGDIVERHITDGDIVIFNRQPSLHRISMMAHKVIVMPSRTLRMNECVCTPYNADFDGDEMNIHVPQTYEAKAEAFSLMGVLQNIRTPRNGDPLIASIQDFITGAYLLTNKNNFFGFDEFSALSLAFLRDEDNGMFKFPIPSILKPFPMWTGKQVISMAVNPLLDAKISVNIRTAGKEVDTQDEVCINDSYVVFFNGLHLFGKLDKNIIGQGSKKTLYYAILKNYGPESMSKIMSRINKVSTFYLTNYGISHSLRDVTASSQLSYKTDELIKNGYHECDKYVLDSKAGKLAVQPGLTMDETLENHMLRILSMIRDDLGKVCVNLLPRHCSPLIMALCGSKGSFINVCQMISCVGQQAITGKRIVDHFEGRTLPRFPRNTVTPDARGFVRSSFAVGLSISEFFFHTMAGREGLVDTAVKTAETGYMQRRLIKCLEDLCVQYDNTVRNSNKQVIQFSYGGDGLDPFEMESNNVPVNFEALMNHLSCFNVYKDEVLKYDQVYEFMKTYLRENYNKLNKGFYKKIKSYIKEVNEKNIVSKKFIVNKAEPYRYRLTKDLLSQFLDVCVKKYNRGYVEPGTTVGSLCAQSIGEPATQMTLKTFHFAGVASMNITLGVPRMKEIINSVANIATPVIRVEVENSYDKDFVLSVKNRIEKTTLDKICSHITFVVDPENFYLEIEIDLMRIKIMGLEIDINTVVAAIKNSAALKFDKDRIYVKKPSIIHLYSKSNDYESGYFELKRVESKVGKIVVIGCPNIHRVILDIKESKNGENEYLLAAEGTDLMKVMATKSVRAHKVTSNDPLAVCNVLGIEAARSTLINELSFTFKGHSIDVDVRHLEILAELMCHTGQILGMTRFGLTKMKDSVLMLASFEGTGDHLFDAAIYSHKDPVKGISESIITGKPVSVGTGMFGLLQKPVEPFIGDTKSHTSKFEQTISSVQDDNF